MILEGTAETLEERFARVRLEAVKANKHARTRFEQVKSEEAKRRAKRKKDHYNVYDNGWYYSMAHRDPDGYYRPQKNKKWEGELADSIHETEEREKWRVRELAEIKKELQKARLPSLPKLNAQKAVLPVEPTSFVMQTLVRLVRMKPILPVAIGLQVLIFLAISLTMLLIVGVNIQASIIVPSVLAGYWHLSRGAAEYRRQRARPTKKVQAVENHYKLLGKRTLTQTQLEHAVEYTLFWKEFHKTVQWCAEKKISDQLKPMYQ